jgi:hypothetical protein
VGGDVLIDSEAFLVTDFVNLKIKLTQSFRCAYRGRVCVRVFIEVSACTCISICVCTVFLKKTKLTFQLFSFGRFCSYYELEVICVIMSSKVASRI